MPFCKHLNLERLCGVQAHKFRCLDCQKVVQGSEANNPGRKINEPKNPKGQAKWK